MNDKITYKVLDALREAYQKPKISLEKALNVVSNLNKAQENLLLDIHEDIVTDPSMSDRGITVTFVHNSFDNVFRNKLRTFCEEHYIGFDSFNEDFKKNVKQALGLKRKFAATLIPFATIDVDGTTVKAFYTEADECTLDNIKNYLKQLYDASTDNQTIEEGDS